MSGPKKGRRTTIYDVASAAEVSPTTVSLVLSGVWKKYRIKPGTALNVIDCARRLGYAANLNARGLRLELHQHNDKYKKKVYILPKHLDEEVAPAAPQSSRREADEADRAAGRPDRRAESKGPTRRTTTPY